MVSIEHHYISSVNLVGLFTSVIDERPIPLLILSKNRGFKMRGEICVVVVHLHVLFTHKKKQLKDERDDVLVLSLKARRRTIPHAPIWVLAQHMQTLDCVAHPPIDTSGNISVHISAKSP